jgi:plastocyanin
MKRIALALIVMLTLVAAMAAGGSAQAPARHTVFGTVVEIKGGTTVDKLAPPPVNPRDLSKGYEFKGPGQADPGAPRRWEVSSYLFVPVWVTVRQGDEVVLTAFVVNGDEHEVWVNDPDGATVVPKARWQRGRQYQVRFVADKAGAYQLLCSNHAPSMTATFYALAR